MRRAISSAGWVCFNAEELLAPKRDQSRELDELREKLRASEAERVRLSDELVRELRARVARTTVPPSPSYGGPFDSVQRDWSPKTRFELL
jgi:hypothetical protein